MTILLLGLMAAGCVDSTDTGADREYIFEICSLEMECVEESLHDELMARCMDSEFYQDIDCADAVYDVNECRAMNECGGTGSCGGLSMISMDICFNQSAP
jgi:hypothetical protein